VSVVLAGLSQLWIGMSSGLQKNFKEYARYCSELARQADMSSAENACSKWRASTSRL
jgi:hypothetical protein